MGLIRMGSSREELMNTLEALDSVTGIDAVICSGQNVQIKCRKFNGKLCDWTLEYKGETKQIPFERGKGYSDLMDAISNFATEGSVNENIVVLCYSYMETARTWNGKLKTWWIVINPAIPFEIRDGMPEFPMLELELTDAEYRIAMESRMALYNELTEDIYPIREVAFSSIGKLLDSAASFKKMAKIPLGSALLLAERFSSDLKDLKFIHRNADGHVKPLIGIAGSRFAGDEQRDFFDSALNRAEEMFRNPILGDEKQPPNTVATIYDWKITDEVSTANAYLHNPDGSNMFALYRGIDFAIYIRMQTSDIPGVSASVTAFAKIGKGDVLIRKNSAYHWDSFTKNGGAKSLFSRIEKGSKKEISLKDDIDDFVNVINKLKNSNVSADEDILGSIHKKVKEICSLIGKKRAKAANIDAIVDEGGNAYEMLESIINGTFFNLPTKQAGELATKYNELVYLLDEVAEESKKEVV